MNNIPARHQFISFGKNRGRHEGNLPPTNSFNAQHAPLSRETSLTDILLQVHPNDVKAPTEKESLDQEVYSKLNFKISDKRWTFTGHRRKEAKPFRLSSNLEEFNGNNNQVARALNKVFGICLKTRKVSEIKRGKDKTNVSLKLNIVEKLTNLPAKIFNNSEPGKGEGLKEYFKGKEYNHLTSAQKHLLELLNRAIPAKTKGRDALGYAERTRNRLEHLSDLERSGTTITLKDLADAFLFVLKDDKGDGAIRELNTSISNQVRFNARIREIGRQLSLYNI